MSLGNAISFVVSEEEFYNTPSRKSGIDELTEFDLRVYGCELIQEAGILLKMPQVTMATAQVFLQRFYFRSSFRTHDVRELAMAAIFLAGKTEETPKKLRDVINVFHHMHQKRNNLPIVPLNLSSPEYWSTKDLVTEKEAWILRELGFHLDVEHPHKFLLNYLSMLRTAKEPLESERRLAQRAWNLLNDSLRTPVIVRFPAEVLATAAIYLAAKLISFPLPTQARWWELFDTTLEDIEEVSRWIMLLYERPKSHPIPVAESPKPAPPIMQSPEPQREAARTSPTRRREETHGGGRDGAGRERSRDGRDDERRRESPRRDRDSRDRDRDRDRERERDRDRDRERDRGRSDRPRERPRDRDERRHH